MRLRIEASNGAVEIEDGRIHTPTETFDHRIVVPDGLLHPGLINCHEHLRMNHFGRLGEGPYANTYEWARDVSCRARETIAEGRKVPRRNALLWGAWKNLLSGVTSVVHHDIWEPDFEQNFPLHVMRVAFADSLGMSPDFVRPPNGLFALHVAEGTDKAAAEEVRTLASRGVLDDRFLAVHAIGPDRDGTSRLRASNCAIIWCPTSNYFLFGRTAPPELLADGMDVLLGTDSLLSGDGDLLDELQAARVQGFLSDTRLADAVGRTAARRLGLPTPSLEPGARADLVVLRRPLLEARAADIVLVVAAGELRVLDPLLADSAGVTGGQLITRANVTRWISEDAALPPRGKCTHTREIQ